MSRSLGPGLVQALLLGSLLVSTPFAEAQAGVRPGRSSSGFSAVARPVVASGSVVLEDGTPVSEPVPIVRVCGENAPVAMGFTSPDGRFSFEIGQGSTTMMDAQNPTPFAWRGSLSAPALQGGSRPPDLKGCVLQAVAPGFSSGAVSLPGPGLVEDLNMGTIVLCRLQGVRGSIFSPTTLQAPKDARKAVEKARARARKQKFDDAIEEYEKAVEADPRFAVAWLELGLVHQMTGRPAEAREAYRTAVAADPELVNPYRQLAFMSFQEQDWPGVLEATGELLWLDPVSYPDAYFFDATAHFYRGELDEAEKSARKVVELDTEKAIPRARAVLGAIFIEKRDYAGAAEQLRAYVEMAAPGPEVEQARAMLSQLEAR